MIRRTTSQSQFVSLREQLAVEERRKIIKERERINSFPQQMRDYHYEHRFDGAVTGAAIWPRCSNYKQPENTFDEKSFLSPERSSQRYISSETPPLPTKKHPNTFEDFTNFRNKDSKTSTKPTLKRSKSFDDLASLKEKKTKSFSELKKELKESIESIKSRIEAVILGPPPKEKPVLKKMNAGISSEEKRSIPRFFRSFNPKVRKFHRW